MKRKVIQIANSTQLVSLPRKWAQKQGINKGDEIDVEIDGDRLIIGGTKKPKIESATLTFKKGEPYIRRPLSTLYKLGYDEVEIFYDDPALIERIKAHTDTLLGFEIIHQSARRCVVKSVAATNEGEFNNMLRRIFLMLVTLGKESLELIEEEQFAQLVSIADLERTNNKLTLFCERVLNKFGYQDHKKQCLLHSLITLLEQVADAYRFICFQLAESKKRPAPSVIKVYKGVAGLTEKVQDTFYDYTLPKLIDFKTTKLEVEGTCYDLFAAKISPQDRIIVHQLLVITYLLHHCTECIT